MSGPVSESDLISREPDGVGAPVSRTSSSSYSSAVNDSDWNGSLTGPASPGVGSREPIKEEVWASAGLEVLVSGIDESLLTPGPEPIPFRRFSSCPASV